MNIGVAFFLFFLLFVIICLSSIIIAHVVDNIQKRLKIGGNFISGIVLALVTSIPELIICFMLLIKDNEEGAKMILGDVYGAMIIHGAALSLLIIIFFKTFNNSNPSKFHILLNGLVFITYSLFLIMIFIPQIKWLGVLTYILSALCVGIYFFDWWIMKQIHGVNVIHVKKRVHSGKIRFITKFNSYLSKISLKQNWFCFIAIGALICTSSYFLIPVSEVIEKKYFVGSEAAFGTIFLALVTSSPEIISSVTLFKMGNINAGISDLLGSTMFDIFIIGLVFITAGWTDGVNTPYYGPYDQLDVRLLAIFSIVSSFLMFLAFSLKQVLLEKGKEKIYKYSLILCCTLCISSYAAYVILAFCNL